MQFIVLSVEWRREMDSLLLFWDTLDGVLNLEENANGNERDTDDPKKQCQPLAEGDLGDQQVVSNFFERLNFSSFFQFLISSISND